MKKIVALILALLVACNHVPAPKDPAVGAFSAKAPIEYTPASVVDAVFKLYATRDGLPAWTGTGWKIDADHMMTAGHVCDNEESTAKLELTAETRWNARYPVKVLRFSRTPDLCVLDASEVPGPAMDQLVKVPTFGDEVWYLGAPHGVWGDGTAPFAKGFYIGGKRMMIAGYPGASGSPVFTKDGVFGILVRGYRGTHLIEFETAADITLLLTEK